MLFEVRGVVLRSVDLGESDRIITVYTKERGLISVMVKGARSLKNRNMAASQLFCYSDMVIYSRADKLYLRESSIIESFFKLRSSIEGLALAQYIAEVLSEVGTADPEEELLRLALNSLFAIAEKKYPLEVIKCVFELRSLAIIGFMPDVLACRECGEREGEFYFDIMSGNIECYACAQKRSARREGTDDGEVRRIAILSAGAKIALGYIVHSPIERIFSFKLSPEDMSLLTRSAEEYLLNQLERSFKSLEFYNEVKR